VARSAASLRRWDRLHTWSSLACTLFLLVLCLTGLPLIFSEEIEAADAAPAVSTAPAGAARLSIDALVAQTTAASPGSYVQFVFWDGQPGIVGLGVGPKPNASLDEIKRVLYDTSSGRSVAERPPPSGVMDSILELHKSLLAGIGGELFLALVAICFLLSILSGIVLYAPFIGRRGFGAMRRTSSRTRWIDAHNFLGIVIAAWLAIVGATGLMNTLEAPLFGLWQAQSMPRLLAPYRDKPYPTRLASIDAAVAAAERAFPAMQPTSVGLPYSQFGSPRHYLIWMKGSTPLTEHFFSTVLVDAADGHVAAAEALPWYLRTLEISRPLHFGDYGGLPLKILWCLFDLVAIIILASGLYLYISRLRRGSGNGLKDAAA
jgi:uncharacterized iron-regulated membrane protein